MTLYILAQLRRWASFLIEYQICLEIQVFILTLGRTVNMDVPKPSASFPFDLAAVISEENPYNRSDMERPLSSR